MLAYGEEEYLHEAVRAVLDSDADLELILVDNGCTSDAVRTLAPHENQQIIVSERNLGFTGGMNLAAKHARGRTLLLVNSDATVAPDAFTVLDNALDAPKAGIACAMVLLADEPEIINSRGNPFHVLGLSWAGSMGKPAKDFPHVTTVAGASGTCMAIRRELWEELGGFPEEFFAYFEDLELSWRCHQQGLTVKSVPQAVCYHHYEFSRSPHKMFLVERNRWLVLLTCHQAHTLALLAPVLLAFEIAMLVMACAQGWGRQKVSSWWWILSHGAWIRRRRALVQSTRTVPDRAIKGLLSDRFDPAQMSLPPGGNAIQALLRAYWRLVKPLV